MSSAASRDGAPPAASASTHAAGPRHAMPCMSLRAVVSRSTSLSTSASHAAPAHRDATAAAANGSWAAEAASAVLRPN
eukprot:scaffold30032_cov138-Isochrysis_galbana.AAC.13